MVLPASQRFRLLFCAFLLCLFLQASSPRAFARSSTNLDALRNRAEHGDTQQQIELGAAYFAGNGIPQNFALAAHWYQKAAESGNALAENQLGYLCQEGIGVPVDMGRALHWYQLAAVSGFPAAKVNLAVLYLNGLGVRANASMAKQLLLEAVGAGVGVGATYLGDMYLFGKGVPTDKGAAEAWFKLGSRLHDPLADFDLAVLYAQGEGHPHDLAKSAELLRLASARGYVPAKYSLACLLLEHPELSQSPREAVLLLAETSDAGNWRASVLLGKLAHEGNVGTMDFSEAYYRFSLAALQGGASVERGVAPDLKDLATHLSSQTQVALHARADAWFQQHRLALTFIRKEKDFGHYFPQIAGE